MSVVSLGYQWAPPPGKRTVRKSELPDHMGHKFYDDLRCIHCKRSYMGERGDPGHRKAPRACPGHIGSDGVRSGGSAG